MSLSSILLEYLSENTSGWLQLKGGGRELHLGTLKQVAHMINTVLYKGLTH